MCNVLPQEIWALVLAHIPDPLDVATVSKKMCAAAYAAYTQKYGPHPGKSGFTWKYALSAGLPRALFCLKRFKVDTDFACNAAKYNALECVLYNYDHRFSRDMVIETYVGAIKGGHIDLIKHVNKRCENTLRFWIRLHTYLCMKYNRRDILAYAESNGRVLNDECVLCYAAYDGNIDLCLQYDISDDVYVDALNAAVHGNQLACIRAMLDRRSTDQLFRISVTAAYLGHLEILKYLCDPDGEIKCKLNKFVYCAAMHGQHQNTIEWCCEMGLQHGCVLDVTHVINVINRPSYINTIKKYMHMV